MMILDCITTLTACPHLLLIPIATTVIIISCIITFMIIPIIVERRECSCVRTG